jgi:hypothetical protein
MSFLGCQFLTSAEIEKQDRCTDPAYLKTTLEGFHNFGSSTENIWFFASYAEII